MNPQTFVNAARRWNRALICAVLTHEPQAVRACYKAKRDASIARAKAFKERERYRAQCARHDADKAMQEFANAI